jgi:hypothetical protein
MERLLWTKKLILSLSSSIFFYCQIFFRKILLILPLAEGVIIAIVVPLAIALIAIFTLALIFAPPAEAAEPDKGVRFFCNWPLQIQEVLRVMDDGEDIDAAMNDVNKRVGVIVCGKALISYRAAPVGFATIRVRGGEAVILPLEVLTVHTPHGWRAASRLFVFSFYKIGEKV